MFVESSLVRELPLARVQVAHSWVAMARIAVGDVLTATTVRKVRCLRLLAW